MEFGSGGPKAGLSETAAAAAWRGRLMASRRQVYRRPGACQGVAGVRTWAHHSARPATAPSQAARPPKRREGRGQALATDWPHTSCALTAHGEQLVQEAAVRAASRPLPRTGGGAAGRPAPAPGGAPPAFAGPGSHWTRHVPYRWVPTQSRQHDLADACSPSGTHFDGTYVNTLSATLDFPDVVWGNIPMEVPHASPVHFRVQRTPQSSLVQQSLVLCRGLVMFICPQRDVHHPEGGLRICCLPEGMRPQLPLRFAALAIDKDDGAELVVLDLTPDGWIACAGHLRPRSVLDLSSVRFCLARGLSLIDGVRLHTCDVPGGRVVVLQGSLAPRALAAGPCSIASLPSSCQPARGLPFVAAGSRRGSFHLLLVRPGGARPAAGEVAWGDSKWQGVDEVSLSGVLFEVAPEAMDFSLSAQPWTANRRAIAIGDFQNCLLCRYGSLLDAWRKAYDGERTGLINFSTFGAGCRAAGYKGDISRLWAMLDVDRSGEISFDELEIDVSTLEVKCLQSA